MRHAQCGNQAVRFRDVFARNVKRCAVVRRSPDEGQAERDIDPFVKGDGLDRDECLIVIHRNRRVIACAGAGVEHRVGGKGAGEGQALGLELRDERRDHVELFMPHYAAFARMGVEARNGNARGVNAKLVAEALSRDFDHAAQFARSQ